MKQGRKTRARQACQTCNARRVKCNINEGSPCTGCATAGIPCILRESRRGKHARKPKRPARSSASDPKETPRQTGIALPARDLTSPPGPHVSEEDASAQADPCENTATPTSLGHSAIAATPRQCWSESLEASQVLATLSRNVTAPSGWLGNSPQRIDLVAAASTSASAPTTDIDETQQAPLHLLAKEGQHDETVFLGESTGIRHLNDTHPSPAAPCPTNRPFFVVPEGVRAEKFTSQWEVERRKVRLKRLESEGAFSFPPPLSVEKLLAAYFRWFHTCFPIVNEPDIWHQYRHGTLSPALLQGILFIGVTHCLEEDLPAIGLGSRHQAKLIFYNRAKDLFDAEAEPSAIVMIQLLFLMSFWRAGPLLQKDTRHWLGAAVSLAQTKALHRSSLSHDTSGKAPGLCKRLWWSIYIRERQCAAALGLPNRVRDEDCDIEDLREPDFDDAFNASSSTSETSQFIAYMMGMAELSRMLGTIIDRDYLPSKRMSHTDRTKIKDTLLSWKAKLPPCMQPVVDGLSSALRFHASMLHLACNNLFVLLYRSECGTLGGSTDQVNGQVAIQAAARNTSIIESLMANGHICHAQIHVITNIFNTLCIHTLCLKVSEGIQRYIAEYRAKLCLLALRELRKTYEVKNWILQLFFQHLDRPTAARLDLGEDSGETSTTQKQVAEQPRTSAGFSTASSHDAQPLTLQDDQNMPNFDAPYNHMSTEDVGQFLYSQIEHRFVNSEGGALDWFMTDLFNST